jgi:hypothetical protein
VSETDFRQTKAVPFHISAACSFLIGFLGALITAVFLLAVKCRVGFLANGAFPVHFN